MFLSRGAVPRSGSLSRGGSRSSLKVPRPIAGEGTVESYHNDILGSDPARWRTRIPIWSKVRQTSIYPGIDLIHHALGSDPEYDFIVAPGADPSRIRLRYFGSQFSANGSGRVRHACFCFISLGSLRSRRYFRAVFVSMPALAATTSNVDFPCATEI